MTGDVVVADGRQFFMGSRLFYEIQKDLDEVNDVYSQFNVHECLVSCLTLPCLSVANLVYFGESKNVWSYK